MSSLCIRVDDEIELRLNELRYADELLALIVKNIDHLRVWMPWAAPEQTLERIQAFMRNSMQRFAEGACLPTNLWYRGELVAMIDFSEISWERQRAEMGYWLDKDLQGRGIITRAARTLVTYAFQEYKLNKVEIHAAAGNQRSRAIAERLGFTQEGIIRQVAWLNGSAHDLVIYGMLANEWKT